jgi:hypothetical protein
MPADRMTRGSRREDRFKALARGLRRVQHGRVGEDRSTPEMARYTVAEAADMLGITTGAVRNRLSRGTLRKVKEGGTVYVLLPAGMSRDTARDAGDIPGGVSHPESDALTSELRDRLRYVEGQLEAERLAHAEARRIIAGLVERIPALEAPAGGPEGPEPGERAGDRGNVATDREQADSVLSGDVRDVDEGVTTSVVTQYVLVGCGIAGSAILYVVGHTDLALLTIGAALLLLSVSDFFYTRSLVRWSYATAALGIIAVLIFVAASLLGG